MEQPASQYKIHVKYLFYDKSDYIYIYKMYNSFEELLDAYKQHVEINHERVIDITVSNMKSHMSVELFNALRYININTLQKGLAEIIKAVKYEGLTKPDYEFAVNILLNYVSLFAYWNCTWNCRRVMPDIPEYDSIPKIRNINDE